MKEKNRKKIDEVIFKLNELHSFFKTWEEVAFQISLFRSEDIILETALLRDWRRKKFFPSQKNLEAIEKLYSTIKGKQTLQ